MWFCTIIMYLPILWSTIASILGDMSEPTPTADEYIGFRNAITEYSEKETIAIKMFRGMVEDVLDKEYEHKDQYLIRFIRANSMNLKAAEEMLRKTKKWRKDNNIDTILSEKHFDKKADICHFQGLDYDGNPVYILNVASSNIRKMMMAGHEYNVSRRIIQCVENATSYLRNLTETTGKEVSKLSVISDVGGFNLKYHACSKCLSVYGDFLRVAQNYYPEYLKVLVILNSPKIIKPFFEMFKPLLNPTMRKSVKAFGVDKLEWSEYLLKFIPADQLSKKFGGTAD